MRGRSSPQLEAQRTRLSHPNFQLFRVTSTRETKPFFFFIFLLPILTTSYTIRRPEISVLIYFRSLLPPDGRAHVEAHNP